MINALVHLPPKQPFRKLPWFSLRLPATGAIFVGELVPILVACTRLVELGHKNRQRLEPHRERADRIPSHSMGRADLIVSEARRGCCGSLPFSPPQIASSARRITRPG
jgi:hypothetical protein